MAGPPLVCRVYRPSGVKVLNNTYVGITSSLSGTFRLWRDAVPRGRGEVEHVLRKHLNEIVDNVPHGYDPGGPAMVIDQGNVLVVPHTHVVENVSEFIVHMQAIRIGCHERPNLQAVYVNLACRHFDEDVPGCEYAYEVAQVDDEHAVYPFALHDLDGLAYGRTALTRNRRLRVGQVPNGAPQPAPLDGSLLLRILLFFLEDVFTHSVSLRIITLPAPA